MNPISFNITPMDLNKRTFAELNSIWGLIYLKFDSACFPDDTWYDAISSVLIMWFEEIIDLFTKRKKQGILYFMDGPYRIEITVLDNDTIECRCMYIEQEHLVVRESSASFVNSFLESTAAFISSSERVLIDSTSSGVLRQLRLLFTELAEIQKRQTNH